MLVLINVAFIIHRLNNCIGHKNQKFFYLFIFYANVYCFFVCLTTVLACVEFVSSSREAFIELDLHWTFLVLVSGVFTLCLVGFVIYHTNLICNNQTTLESMQVKNYKVKEDGEVTTSKYLNLFDVGTKNNWVQVMGPQWYFWFVPVYNS